MVWSKKLTIILASVLFISVGSWGLYANQFLNLKRDEWIVKHFKNKSDFSVNHDAGDMILTIQSEKSASLYFKYVDIDLDKTPFLNWNWKVNRVFDNQNEKVKAGDDFPARLLVAYEEGMLGSDTVGFSFVWCSRTEEGVTWPSPVSSNIKMVSKQSGQNSINTWQVEKVDLKAAFLTLQNRSIRKINYIALMADTDNLSEEVTAQFKNIYFSQN